MKRKLTLVLLALALFVCVFAISVSAKTVYLEEIPEELKIPNDTVTHFVVIEEAKYFSLSDGTVNYLNASEIAADLTSAGIDATKIGTEYLTKIIIPEYNGETPITSVQFNGTFKENKDYFWDKVGYIRLPGTVKTITDMNETTQKLRYFDFGENSQITEIPGWFMCDSFEIALIENLPQNLTSIGKSAFSSCYSGFRGELYLNATTIGDSAFNNSLSHVTKLTLGPKTQTIGGQSLCVRLEEVDDNFEPEDHKIAITELVFECDVSKVTFATQGNNTGSFYFPVSTARSPYAHLEKIVLAHPDNERAYVDGATFNDFTADGITILFNDADGLDDYVTVYHSFDTVKGISYESLLEKGAKSIECSKCGAITEEETAPVFEFLGYSYKIDETRGGGIACGYTVDKDAYDEYVKWATGEVSCGIIIFNAETEQAQNATTVFTNDKLTLADKAVQVGLSDMKYSIINISISGFTDQYKDTGLVLALYVTNAVTEDEVTTYKSTFAQGTTNKQSESVVKGYYEKSDYTLATVSYNSIVK